jgi:tetratricopeptide (TPR) repeat protein
MALHGMRGIGKTTLVAAYAEKHRREYRATWWIRAQTESTIRADLIALGVRLGWVDAGDKEEPALATVLERLSQEGEHILLIYDNAIDAHAIKSYLPRGGSAHVLVTSNLRSWRGVVEPIEVGLWPKKIGADYLVMRVGQTEGREAALALSEMLGGLPLAHEQAAAYCEHTGVSLEEYSLRFGASSERLLHGERDVGAKYNDRTTIGATFSLAIDEAVKLHPAATALIIHVALLSAEPIPLFLFSDSLEKFGEPLASSLKAGELDSIVTALRAFALIDRETISDERDPAITTDCIRLHPLVRHATLARSENNTFKAERRALVEALATVYPRNVYNDPKTWPRARRLDPLALALVDGSAALPDGVEKEAAQLLIGLESYREAALGAYAQARKLSERALEIREAKSGPEHPDTAQSLDNLARLLQAQGDLAGARPLFDRALRIYERTLGPEHRQTATSLNNLAVLLQEQGDLAAARPLYERALAIRERNFGPEHPSTATSLNDLARLHQAQGDLVGALSLMERALNIREKVLGLEHPDTATSLNDLARLHYDLGDFAGAETQFTRALAIYEKILGPEHPYTATTLNNLARVRQMEGRLDEAQSLYSRSLSIWSNTLGSEHPYANVARRNLARLFLAQGKPVEALALAEPALAAHDKALGPSHSWTKDSARVAIGALEAVGRGEEAVKVRAKYDLDKVPSEALGVIPRVSI